LRRYYPGFFGAAFLVLLRIAIGWHLMYEGIQKIMSTPEGKSSFIGRLFVPTAGPSFSSEGYQRNATGPFADQFRNLIPDVDSRRTLSPGDLVDQWYNEMLRIGNHFIFDKSQQAKADELLDQYEAQAVTWFKDIENHQKITKYLDGLEALAKLNAKPNKMSYEVERFYEGRKSLEADRRSLVGPLDAWTKALRESWVKLAKPEQVAEYGEYKPERTEVQRADMITMYGLTICGFCLIIGFLTPFAGLGAAGFLALFYISMPPWPGLPEAPNAEGHYSIVNKNLIELIACLGLATLPTGMWIGLDAFFFGWIGRYRQRRANAKFARELTADLTPTNSTTINATY
jgi:uncharacterized membrane protein YphA (DoxX/SURF4 family)